MIFKQTMYMPQGWQMCDCQSPSQYIRSQYMKLSGLIRPQAQYIRGPGFNPSWNLIDFSPPVKYKLTCIFYIHESYCYGYFTILTNCQTIYFCHACDCATVSDLHCWKYQKWQNLLQKWYRIVYFEFLILILI